MNAIIGHMRSGVRRSFAQTRSTDVRRYYQASKPDYAIAFDQFLTSWRGDVGHLSCATDIVRHPAFQSIVFMGRKAIPLILEELHRFPDCLVAALPLIAGENPVADEDEGDVDAMIAAWEAWAQNQTDV